MAVWQVLSCRQAAAKWRLPPVVLLLLLLLLLLLIVTCQLAQWLVLHQVV